MRQYGINNNYFLYEKDCFITLLACMTEILSAMCAVTYVMSGDTFSAILPNPCATYTLSDKVIGHFDFLKSMLGNFREA